MSARSHPRLWALRLPPDASRAARVLHGFLLPLVVLQALLRNPADRRRYLKVTVTQAVITLLVAVMLVPLYRYLTEVSMSVEREAEAALQQTLGVMQTRVAEAVRGDDAADEKADAEGRQGAPAEDSREDALLALGAAAAGFRSELSAIAVTPPTPPVGSIGPVPPAPPAPPSPRVRLRGPAAATGEAEAETRREQEAVAREQAAEAREREADARELNDEARQLNAGARELQAEARALRAEARAREQALQQQMREVGQAVREQTAGLRELALRQAAQAREAAAADPALARELEASAAEVEAAQEELKQELEASQQELTAALRENDAELQEELSALRTSADALAREAAVRAAEAVRARAQLAPPRPPEVALESLSERIEAQLTDVAPPEQVELAMQAAVEASFVAERAREQARVLRGELRRAGPGGMSAAQRAAAEEAVEELEEQAEEARALAREARDEAKVALQQVVLAQRQRAGITGPTAQQRVAEALGQVSPRAQLLVYLAALYAALYVVQFFVIALSREHHDLLSRRAALATRIEPEDPELTPRLRLDWRWLRNRLGRRWRALKLFAFGVPAIYLVTWPLPGDVARTVLLSLWGAYWFAVHVAAKSARAWVDEGLASEPWFLRASAALTRRIPLLGKPPFNLYANLWRRHGGPVFAPAECVERQPYDFAGLTVFRFLASLPLLKLFLRPLTSIAVAHLLESARAERPARADRLAAALGRELRPTAS